MSTTITKRIDRALGILVQGDGPGSFTQDAIARLSANGDIRDSGVTIDDDDQVTNRKDGFTNTGTKQPHGFRVDINGSDITNGYGSFQSLIQVGASATSVANTDWAMVGTVDLITMSGWVLNWGSTPIAKNVISGNFGIAFENISNNAAQVAWALELDVGNYTGTGAFGDERYGVGLKLNAFGSVGSAVSKAIGISRSTTESGNGFRVGVHMDGVRSTGIQFEAMTEVGSGTILNGKLSGDSVVRFALEYDGTMSWGSGGGAVDVTLSRVAAGFLSCSGSMIFNSNTLGTPAIVAQMSENSASSGPQLTVHRVSTSPAANDLLGSFFFSGRDSNGNDAGYARLQSQAIVVTDGSEGGALMMDVSVTGTLATRLKVDNTATARDTALLIYDVDNNNLDRVTVGVADSGGAGFKVLRIPN